MVPGEFNCAEEVVGERPDELQFLGLQVGARLGDVLMSHPRKKVWLLLKALDESITQIAGFF